MPLRSRDKGRRAELEVVKILQANGWPGAKRNAEAQASDGGVDIVGVHAWAIECKWAEGAGRSDLTRWWHQTCRQADACGRRPVLFWRDNSGKGLPIEAKWRAMVRLSDLLLFPGDSAILNEDHAVIMLMAAWLDRYGEEHGGR